MIRLSILSVGFLFCVFANVRAVADPSEPPTYAAKSYGEVRAKGLVRTPQSREFLLNTPSDSFTNAPQAVPGTYSLRGLAGPVEDQGQCGDCWNFSLTTVLRGTWMMAGKDPGRLSFNYLLNCSTKMSGCDGGDFGAAEDFIKPKGAPAYGTDGEYTATDGECVEPKTFAASAVSYKLLGDDGGNFPKAKTPSFKDIAYVVGVLHKPVSIDITADDTFESYASGIYNGCSDEKEADINHMVVVEGYSCEKNLDANGNCVFDAKGNLPNGTGLWLIRNSWGTSWGDKGYVTMKATDSKGLRCNGVATDALYYHLTK